MKISIMLKEDDEKWKGDLGKIELDKEIVPRIGEKIRHVDIVYEIIDVIHVLEWDRIEAIELKVKKL